MNRPLTRVEKDALQSGDPHKQIVAARMVQKRFRRKPAERGCLGYEVPAIVICQDNTIHYQWNSWLITVSALDPRKEMRSGIPQGKGLFINGPRIDNPEIAGIFVKRWCSGGERVKIQDVTKFVKRDYSSRP